MYGNQIEPLRLKTWYEKLIDNSKSAFKIPRTDADIKNKTDLIKVSNFYRIIKHNPEMLKMAIQAGPVAVQLNGGANVFKDYESGIINAIECEP